MNQPWPAQRLPLIRAEARWLAGDHAAAQDLAQGTLQRINDTGGQALADTLGRADAHWLLGMIATAQGHIEIAKAELAVQMARIKPASINTFFIISPLSQRSP